MAVYAALIWLLIRKHKNVTGELATVRRNWSKVLLSLFALFILAYVSYYALVNFSASSNR